MPYPNEHACRLKDPDQYDRIRRVNCDRKHDGKCIDVLYGVKKNKSEEQAYRYDKEVWTEKSARNHCEDNGGTFEAASDEESNLVQFPGNIPPKPWYTMDSAEDSAEIEIFDVIGGWFGVEVGQFKKDFDKIKNKKEIKVLLNSPGGSVFDGMAIYNILAAYKSKITTEIIGIAASVASVIALAGKTRNICQGSYFMIHDPSGLCIGTADDMRKLAKILEKMAGQIANIYTSNSNLDKDDVLQKMSEETWFTAEEALEAGFADNVVDYGEMAAMAFDIGKYSYAHVPEEIQKLAANFRWQQAAFETENDSVSEGGESYDLGGQELKNLKDIIEALSALNDEERAKATDEDKKKVAGIFGLDELEKQNAELAASVKDLKAKAGLQEEKISLLLNEKQETAKELADLKKLNAQTEKQQVIEKALSEGKITPKNRTRWEEQYDRDPEGTKKLLELQDPVVDFSTRGTGAGGDESSLNAEEQKMADKAGLSKEEIKKYGPKAGEEK